MKYEGEIDFIEFEVLSKYIRQCCMIHLQSYNLDIQMNGKRRVTGFEFD